MRAPSNPDSRSGSPFRPSCSLPESRVRTRSGKRLEVSRRCPVAARGGVGGAGRLVLALMLLALGSIAGCGEDTGLVDEIGMGESVSGSVVLRFGAISDGDEIEQRQRFGILAAALEERLSVSVDYVHSADFAAALESFREGDLHFAWFDGLAGVRARNAVPGARAIAQGVEDSQYYSYWIANRKLGLEPGEAFPMNSRGLVFSFGPLDSTSGRLMPEYLIREETGEEPRDFYSEVGFSASHRETLALVDVGTVDLGALDPIAYGMAPAEEKAPGKDEAPAEEQIDGWGIRS